MTPRAGACSQVFFAREDWKVLQATDGDVGIELALRNRPELILCDLLMPKSNGFQVCRTIREQLQPTKIVVVSGRDYGVDKISAMQAGADEYLLKPVTWELLSRTIDRLLPQIPRKSKATPPAGDDSQLAWIKFWGVRGSIPIPGVSPGPRLFYFCSTFGPLLAVPRYSLQFSIKGSFPYEKGDRRLMGSDQIKLAISEFESSASARVALDRARWPNEKEIAVLGSLEEGCSVVLP
jgi:CheY-like chemotaxis protein